MPYKALSTAKIARAAGCHPNTVRKYEDWGLISPVKRNAHGYRLYTQLHLDQMRLARGLLRGGYAGRVIRRSAYEIIHLAAQGRLGDALEQAYHHLATVQAEIAQAEASVALLRRWAGGVVAESNVKGLRISAAARQLNLTPDVLRSWERDNLLSVPRDPDNGYRVYSQAELSRLRVIRMLRQSGYSTIAIQRMLRHLDGGSPGDLRQVLDTPQPDEDVYSAADRWLTTLTEQDDNARQAIALLEKMLSPA